MRKIAKAATVGILAVAGLAFGPRAYVAFEDRYDKERIEKQISALETKLTKEYDVEIGLWQPPVDNERPMPSTKTSLLTFSPYVSLKALQGLQGALECYPADMIQGHVKKIELVRSFISAQGVQGTPLANWTWWGKLELRAGGESNLIYHAAVLNRVFDKYDLHHELAHEFTTDFPEDKWLEINPSAEYKGDKWISQPEYPKGFYNRYATNTVREDIASTAELLYNDRRVYAMRTGDDPVLKAKAEFLKKWYLKKSGGRFDEQYWSDVQLGLTPRFSATKKVAKQ